MNFPLFAAQDFHDIAPPVGYSLLPTWVVFVIAFAVLTLLGLLAWSIRRWWKRRPAVVRTPREIAVDRLERARPEIERVTPYQFSISVSDVLRRYVTEQFQLPLTRQTSVEFLNALRSKSEFSEEETLLLRDFLSRCDLIKFARYEATKVDSEQLLEEAFRFVKGGGQLAPA